jgi:hypothetical protein
MFYEAWREQVKHDEFTSRPFNQSSPPNPRLVGDHYRQKETNAANGGCGTWQSLQNSPWRKVAKEVKNGTPDLCREPRCKNPRRFNKKRKAHDLHVCHKHESRRKRAANKMWAAWRALKDHAKSRRSKRWPKGIPFHLKLGDFVKFARQTDYLNRTGNNGHCLTVDRIDDTRGYFKNNIQPLTRIKNSEKKARQDAIRMKAGLSWQENT